MKRIFLTFILTTSLLLSVACVQKGNEGGTTNTSDTIKVGVFADLSGTIGNIRVEERHIEKLWDLLNGKLKEISRKGAKNAKEE